MGIEQGVGFPITAVDVFSGAFDKLSARVTRAKNDFSSLSASLAGISSALTIAGFAAFVKSTTDSHEEVGKLSQKLGIAVGELSAYKYALNQSDVTLEAFGKGVKTLSQKLVEATDSSTKAGRLFSTLGVDLAKGTTPAVEKIADAFARLPDGTTKAALAVELFGKAGMDMIPFLNQGSAGIRLMKEEAARLGLVMNEETTKAAEQFNDNLKAISASSQRLGIELLNSLGPAMTRITSAMKEAAAEGGILKALWVGMGGVASEALGLNKSDAEKQKARITEIREELARLNGEIISGAKAGIIVQQELINQRRPRIQQLEDELRLLRLIATAGAGGFDDQASRRGRQGQGRAGPDTGFNSKLNSILSGESAKRVSELAKEFETLQAKLTGAAAGLDSGFMQSLGTLNVALATGKVGLEEHAKLVDLLIKQQPFYVKGLERELKAEKVLEDQREEERKDREALLKLGDDRIRQVNEDNEMARLEADLIGATNVERELALNSMEKEKALRNVLDPYQRSTIENLYTERAALILVRDAREKAFENGVGFWRDLADGARDFAQNVRSVGGAFDWLKNKAIQVGRDILGIFAQKITLYIGAAVTSGNVSGALANQAAQTGSGTFSGGIMSGIGNATGLTGAASGMYAGFLSGTSEAALGASFVGPSATLAGGSTGFGATMGTAMSGIYEALAAVPVWGWIAMAVIAIGAWIASSHKGGPKVGGSFMGSFDSSGNSLGAMGVPGSDNGRFFTPNQMDSETQKLVEGIGHGFAETLARFGGTSGKFGFGLGFDHDPQGTAQSRVSSMVTDANGRVIYRVADRSMDDKEVPAALMLEGQRMVLAALQASQLPPAIAAILKTVDAASASQEQIDAVFQLADAFQTLTKSLASISSVDLVADASKSAMDVFAMQGNALLDLAGKSTMTVQSLQTLTAATLDYRSAAVQLILGFESAKRQIDEMFGATARNIKLAGLDDQGKYNFYQNESQQLLEQALKSNDAGEIQRLSGLVNQDINAAFALLSPEQQASMQKDWLDRLNKANQDIQDRLTKLQTDAQDKANETLGKIDAMMTKNATDMGAAANTQLQASNNNLAASNRTVDVHVDVSNGTAVVNDGG